jgi:two-component system, chemotaxis family, chemotaxis protein CheY
MRVLIAEDEPDICRTYKVALEYRNHEVTIAENGDQCIAMYKQEFFNQTNTKATSEPPSILPAKSISSSSPSSSSSSSSSSTSSTSSPASSNTVSSDEDYYSSSPSVSPFDVVILDYSMPGKDGIEVAKEILQLNPQQRIIFASAYVRDTLEDAVKQLKQVVELMQKPFDTKVLVDTIEDREVRDGIKKLMKNLRLPSQENETELWLGQITDLFEGLRKIQKGRTF